MKITAGMLSDILAKTDESPEIHKVLIAGLLLLEHSEGETTVSIVVMKVFHESFFLFALYRGKKSPEI